MEDDFIIDTEEYMYKKENEKKESDFKPLVSGAKNFSRAFKKATYDRKRKGSKKSKGKRGGSAFYGAKSFGSGLGKFF